MEQEFLEISLGVSFHNKELLYCALTHSSYLNENPNTSHESNERMEFLGDAVIGLAVADELYINHPEWPEGKLTEARASIVRGETLGIIANDINLGDYLYMGKGEALFGGRNRPTNLAAALEAIVGALYLDQGYNEAKKLTVHLLSQEISSIGHIKPLKDHKSFLQEVAQSRGLPSPLYKTVDVSGQKHEPLFTVEVNVNGNIVGRGTGKRKSLAEQEAASNALLTWAQEAES